MSTKKMTTKEGRAFIKEKIAECKAGCDHGETQRYRIMSDESGHDYFIPVKEETWFESWLLTFEDNLAEENYEGPDYEKNRIDGTFTFTDPRCD